MLGDQVEIHAAPTMFSQHSDVIGGRARGWTYRKIVVAFINQEDGAIRFILPVFNVDLLPSGKLAALYRFEAPVMADRA